MMMMGEGVSSVPPWCHLPVSGVDILSVGGGGEEMTPYLIAALREYLPSNDVSADDDEEAAAMAAAVDAYACDEFRMYEFKVRRCARGRSHDWTECPFAHPGRLQRGDACEYAHGVFECWLHPTRYRTQPCKDGTACRRRVCFFAHTPDQLRVLPPQQSSRRAWPPRRWPSPTTARRFRRQAFESYLTKSIMSSSPTSTLLSPPKSPPSDSPPLSPDGAAAIRRGSWPGVGSPVNDVVASLRHLRLNKLKPSRSGGWTSYR
ncbi:hypothetical protein GUJ93_ZPchr0001g29592 [Zizania palustris]|uniref:AtC3H23-like CCCH zinc finger domain-containing protein n=1 Tax=Zizania palustris TaxID=103762 RepID=A0A8J5S9F5_ZIZPA|nr:hypothetical protein GUJ93_ZPchr0001g29592 [Zizania palustris]